MYNENTDTYKSEVLIVAKCNVNSKVYHWMEMGSVVLIVAKCNVNQYSDLKFEVIFEY